MNFKIFCLLCLVFSPSLGEESLDEFEDFYEETIRVVEDEASIFSITNSSTSFPEFLAPSPEPSTPSPEPSTPSSEPSTPSPEPSTPAPEPVVVIENSSTHSSEPFVTIENYSAPSSMSSSESSDSAGTSTSELCKYKLRRQFIFCPFLIVWREQNRLMKWSRRARDMKYDKEETEVSCLFKYIFKSVLFNPSIIENGSCS